MFYTPPLDGKMWGADLPKSPVMLNPQSKVFNQSTYSSSLWASGQTDSLLRLCRTASFGSALVNSLEIAGKKAMPKLFISSLLQRTTTRS
jgi:hypothetical protein